MTFSARLEQLQRKLAPLLPHMQMWEWQLEELALYFLLYTEAANLRHLPEALWFLFWVLRNSPHRMAQV
jgi:hypothetical protein